MAHLKHGFMLCVIAVFHILPQTSAREVDIFFGENEDISCGSRIDNSLLNDVDSSWKQDIPIEEVMLRSIRRVHENVGKKDFSKDEVSDLYSTRKQDVALDKVLQSAYRAYKDLDPENSDLCAGRKQQVPLEVSLHRSIRTSDACPLKRETSPCTIRVRDSKEDKSLSKETKSEETEEETIEISKKSKSSSEKDKSQKDKKGKKSAVDKEEKSGSGKGKKTGSKKQNKGKKSTKGQKNGKK